MMNAVAATLLGAALSARAQEASKREFPVADVKEVRLSAESGPIEVRGGIKIEVEVVENVKPELCRITTEVQNGALVLRAENSKGKISAGCGAGFRVSAPASLPVDAKTGSGNVRAAGRAASLRVSAGSGNILIEGANGEADLRTGSGNISGTMSGRVSAKCGSGGVDLRGLTSEADVKTGSGGVTMAWAKAPEGRVDVSCGSGDVRLVFPPGTRLQASQTAGSGKTVNKFGDTPGAALKVSIKTGSGGSVIEWAK